MKPLLAEILPQSPGQWQIGKKFYVTDSRISLIFQNYTSDDSLAGRYITYRGVKPVTEVDGSTGSLLFFESPEGKELGYRVSASPDSLKRMGSLSIPFTIERSMVDHAAEVLQGKSFYVLTRQWRDSLGDFAHGRKYIPVLVTEVREGTVSQPVMVGFKDEDDNTGWLYLTNESLTLSSLNPLDRVQNLTKANRKLIIDGKLAQGMTTQEARLSLGEPNTVDRGVTYAGIVERWSYENGVYLQFLDGLLQQFRQ